jgi:hypothetical protein
MTWQSSEEMTETPVKPTVQKKALLQAWLHSMHVLVTEGFLSKVFSTG